MTESEQLTSEADPGILVLFQDWLERLEEEAIEVVEKTGSMNPIRLADELGLSESGGIFLVARLKKKKKLNQAGRN